MSFKSATITHTSPLFGADIVSAVKHFWSLGSQSSPVWQTTRWCEFLLKVRQVQECIFVGHFTPEDELVSYVLVQIRNIGLGCTGGFVVAGPNFLVPSS